MRSIFALKPQNIVRLTSYIFVIGLFLVGGGIFFYRVFNYLETLEIIGPILTKRIISLAFLIFLTMIFLSSIITALSTFFRSKEVEFLMSLPIPIERIFFSKFFENTFYCSWATIIAAIPLTWAFGLSQNYHFSFYPLSLFALFLFILIPSATGVIILMFLVNVLGNITRKRLMYVVIVLIAVFAIIIFISQPSVLRVPFTDDINVIDTYIEQLRIENRFLPSDHLVKFLSEPFTQTSFRFLLLLFTSAVFSVALSHGIALGVYKRGWNNSFESVSSGNKRRYSNLLFNFLIKLKIPHTVASLIVKDVRMFTRLPSQWGQAVIFLVLLPTYIISLKRTPIYENVPFWLAIISFINLGFTGYIVATLSTRFVYPAISLEGKSIGFLRSSPVRMRQFFIEKFFISFIPNWFLAEFVIVFSNIALKSTIPFTLICAGITTVYTVTIISISIGFGALFPDFNESNPSKIAAGGGGVLTAILSLLYIAVSTVIIAIPTRRFISSAFQLEQFHLKGFIFCILIFIVVSFLFSIIPLKAGMRSLRRMEI
ncbi:hypothetical protein KAX75_12695 [candidate division WOR-3 bacterium]|nr:hypothetical protein [candidate division WOR-3 bacterium]